MKYGFAKNEQDNINDKELTAFKLLANDLLHYNEQCLNNAIKAKELIEVEDNG